MTAPTLTLAKIKTFNPCDIPEGLPKRKKITAAMAVEAGVSFSDLVWVCSKVAEEDKDIERRLRLWMADCAARVLHIFEKYNPDDVRPRKAIEAARAYARGEIDLSELDAAWDAAWDAARAAARGAARAAARAAAWCAGRDAVWAAARGAARAAARNAAWRARAAAMDAWAAARDAWGSARGSARGAAWSAASAAWSAARGARSAVWDAVWDAEKQWQFDHLVQRMSDNEPEDWPLDAQEQQVAT